MGHKELPFSSRVPLQHVPPPVFEEAHSKKEHPPLQPSSVDYRALPLAPISSRGNIPPTEERMTGWSNNRAVGNSLARPSTAMGGGRNFAHGPSKSIPNVYPSTPLVLSTTLQKTRSTANEEQTQPPLHRPTPTTAKHLTWDSLQHTGQTPGDTLRERREQLAGLSAPTNPLATFPVAHEPRPHVAPNTLLPDVTKEHHSQTQPTVERTPSVVPTGGTAEAHRKQDIQPVIQAPTFSGAFIIPPPAPLVLSKVDNGDIGIGHKPSEQPHFASATYQATAGHSPPRRDAPLTQFTHPQPISNPTFEAGTHRQPPSFAVRPPPVPPTPLVQPVDVLPRFAIHPPPASVSASIVLESRHPPASSMPPFPALPKALETQPSTSTSATSRPAATSNLLYTPSSGQNQQYSQAHLTSLVAVPEEGKFQPKMESKPSPRFHLTEAFVPPVEPPMIEPENQQGKWIFFFFFSKACY